VAVALLAVWGACTEPTQVLVWVQADPGSKALQRARSIRVVVLDEDGGTVLDQTRSLVGDPPEQKLPASVSLVPKADDATRSFEVQVTLVDNTPGAPTSVVASQFAQGSFVPHAIREIRLAFDDACVGVACGDGRTCIDGACQRGCFQPTPPGQVARSVPTACPCRCACGGDQCEGGNCIPTQPVTAIAAGHAHACAILASGSVECWGDNSHGQLGTGDTAARDKPAAVSLPARAKSIAAGPNFSCAALEDMSVRCWGAADEGQLGPGATSDQSRPIVLVDGSGAPVSGVVSVAAGGLIDATEPSAHACGVLVSGDMMCWGRNDYGQLGTGMTGGMDAPSRVMATASTDNVAEMMLGGYHTCARQQIGRFWCWGRDKDYQIGFADHADTNLPEMLTSSGAFSNVVHASAGTWHTCAVTGAGGLWCWGEAAEGRDGVPYQGTKLMQPTQVLTDRAWQSVGTGMRHTCSLEETGSLWCFGTSSEGETGVPSAMASTSSPPVELRDESWTALALGTSFTCGIRQGGALYCFGRNAESQLGIGGTTGAPAPARVCFP
jgi:alpha-tubulin suppressor-like RCC1 family protein